MSGFSLFFILLFPGSALFFPFSAFLEGAQKEGELYPFFYYILNESLPSSDYAVVLTGKMR